MHETPAFDPHACALVLFSGGQDSTACLAWALERYARVETVGFDYGQRHAVELQARAPGARAPRRGCSPTWAARLGPDHVLDIRGFGAMAQSALTSDRAIEMTERGLPSTFVPGRNLVFLTYAAALADRRGLDALVGGMCETDYLRLSRLPARHAGRHGERAATSAWSAPFRIETPLMRLTKAADLGPGQGAGRRGPGRADRRGQPHLLPRRARPAPRLGLRLRRPARPASCAPRAGAEWVAGGRPALAAMTYAVKEIFLTLQGEGGQAGRAAVFCRFAGCNLWSGREAGPGRRRLQLLRHRLRRHGRRRAAAGSRRREALAAAVAARVARPAEDRLVVCTGGEPLLQLDAPLIDALHARGLRDRGGDQRHASPRPTGSTGSASAPRPTRRWPRPRGQELKLVYPAARASIRRGSSAWLSSASSCSRWTGRTARRTPRRRSPIALPTRAGV